MKSILLLLFSITHFVNCSAQAQTLISNRNQIEKAKADFEKYEKESGDFIGHQPTGAASAGSGGRTSGSNPLPSASIERRTGTMAVQAAIFPLISKDFAAVGLT